MDESADEHGSDAGRECEPEQIAQIGIVHGEIVQDPNVFCAAAGAEGSDVAAEP